MSFIVATTLLVAFFLFVLGSTSLDSIFGFHSCDIGYWIFFSLIYISLAILSIYAYKEVNKELTIKRENDYPFETNDFRIISFLVFIKFQISGKLKKKK
jgi:hypothetical protein